MTTLEIVLLVTTIFLANGFGVALFIMIAGGDFDKTYPLIMAIPFSIFVFYIIKYFYLKHKNKTVFDGEKECKEDYE